MGHSRWRQCSVCGKLIPLQDWEEHTQKQSGAGSAYIQGDIPAFISPIDGSVIDDRRKLRNHNKKHGVTDSRDYSADFFEKKHKERSADLMGTSHRVKQARLNDIRRAIEKHGG